MYLESSNELPVFKKGFLGSRLKIESQTALQKAMTLAYARELSLLQWEVLESLLPPTKASGRPRSVNLMSVVQAILYVLITGCAGTIIAPGVSALFDDLLLLRSKA